MIDFLKLELCEFFGIFVFKWFISIINIQVYNLGTGRGVSVLELIKTFETTNNVQVPFTYEARRPGDISAMYADP